MKAVYIYALNCPLTGQPRYIGKSVNPNRRFRAHLKAPENCRRTNWIRDLQSKVVVPELEMLAQVPAADADQWEMDYISIFKTLGFDLVNGTPGGDGVKGRFGNAHPLFGKNHSPEACAKISASLTGKKQSDETRQKRSRSMRLLGPNSGAFKPGHTTWNNGITGEKSSSFGRTHTSEAREKMRRPRPGMSGKKQSPEHIAKRVAALTGKTPWNKGMKNGKRVN